MTLYHMPYVEVFRDEDGEWYWRRRADLCAPPDWTTKAGEPVGPFADEYTATDDAKQSNMVVERTRRLEMQCSICLGPIEVEVTGWAGGSSAEPINDGRCCETCSSLVVTPTRIRRLRAASRSGCASDA